MSEVTTILQRLPGLAETDRRALTDLGTHFRRRSYKDELLCREGDPADTLWVLAQGELEVVKRSDAGREFVVATLDPVTLFGHVGLFTSSGRTASIRAHGPVEVLQMSSTQAHLVLRTSPYAVSGPFRRALILALSHQLQAATQSLYRLADEMGATETVQPDAEQRLLRAHSAL